MPACMRSARRRISTSPATGPATQLRDGLNAHLRPEPVAILSAEPVAAGFDARFSAIRRHYRYRIVTRRAPLGARPRPRLAAVARALDAVAMHRAAQRLLGTHDFTTFRSTECQAKSPVRTLDRLDVLQRGEEIVVDGVRPLVPAQPGALDRRLAEARRRGKMERRRHDARA